MNNQGRFGLKRETTIRTKSICILCIAWYYALLWPLGAVYSQSETRQFRVTGAIVDVDGQPVVGAIVCGEQDLVADVLNRVTKSAVSDASGRYSLELDVHVSPQSALLPIRVFKPGYAIVQRNFSARAEQTEVELQFALEPARRIAVCLVDKYDKPVAGAKLAGVQPHQTGPNQFWLTAESLDSLGIESPSSDAEGLIELAWLSAENQYDLSF